MGRLKVKGLYSTSGIMVPTRKLATLYFALVWQQNTCSCVLLTSRWSQVSSNYQADQTGAPTSHGSGWLCLPYLNISSIPDHFGLTDAGFLHVEIWSELCSCFLFLNACVCWMSPWKWSEQGMLAFYMLRLAASKNNRTHFWSKLVVYCSFVYNT